MESTDEMIDDGGEWWLKKIMKATLFVLFTALLMVGCGEDAQKEAEQEETKEETVQEKAQKEVVQEKTQKEAVQEKAKDDQSIPKKKVVKLVIKYFDWSNLKDRNGVTYLAEGSWFWLVDSSGKRQSDESINTDKPFRGVARRYYENGQLEIRASFKNGYPSSVTQYQEDGTRKWSLHFREGKVVGSDLPFEDWSDINSSHLTYSVVYDENGKEECTRNYKDGKLNGLSFLIEKGKFIKLENYKDGKLDGPLSWRIKGADVDFLRAFYEDGKLMSAMVRKPDGKWCTESKVKNGNGVLVWYNKDGTENYREVYKDGIKVED